MWLTPLNGSWGHPAEGRETAFEAENEVSRFVGVSVLPHFWEEDAGGEGKGMDSRFYKPLKLERAADSGNSGNFEKQQIQRGGD